MSAADRWIMPNGVAEILPAQAQRVELLRRKLLDLYRTWGYELVIPPLIEFSESLLIGLGSDMESQTFKFFDHLSDRTLAIRADITPQTARIDAHSLSTEGVNRLCYAGTVVHRQAKSLLASRTPIEVGAELYGHSGIASDCEVIQLMLETLNLAGLASIHLDLGHVGIFRALVEVAKLNPAREQQLFDALQRKSLDDVQHIVAAVGMQPQLAQVFCALVTLHGGVDVIARARTLLGDLHSAINPALDTLAQVADQIAVRSPEVELYFDLAELRGYHYHTGLVFSALVPGVGYALANGGRYDNIGKVFGRARPATGFSTNLTALINAAKLEQEAASAISVLHADDPQQWQAIQDLRQQGKVVVVDYEGAAVDERCDYRLVKSGPTWRLEPIKP